MAAPQSRLRETTRVGLTSPTDAVDEMAEQLTCDCCKLSVQMVNEIGLCFSCDAFHSFTTIIKEETDLTDDEALALAGELHEHILSEIIDRLVECTPASGQVRS